MDFNSWIRQPTTIHGLAVLAAGAGAALAHVATGNHTVDAAIAVIAYVAVHLGVDDHSAAEQSAGDFILAKPTNSGYGPFQRQEPGHAQEHPR